MPLPIKREKKNIKKNNKKNNNAPEKKKLITTGALPNDPIILPQAHDEDEELSNTITSVEPETTSNATLSDVFRLRTLKATSQVVKIRKK